MEEVVRLYGFSSIAPRLPSLVKRPSVLTAKIREQTVRSFLSWTGCMTEQKNYVLFDEEFLRLVGWGIQDSIELKNPISHNQRRLVTTLLSGLFKNVHDNIREHESLRFFELGRVWLPQRNALSEKKRVAGIFFEKKGNVDFYEGKSVLQSLMTALDVKQGIWEKVMHHEAPWMDENRAAHIIVDDIPVGVAGMVRQSFLRACDALDTSSAFAFEFDADYLFTCDEVGKRYRKTSKYQEVTFDVSCLVPYTSTTYSVEHDIRQAHSLIERVEMIDFFEKKDWGALRSLTFRVYVQHYEHTLTRDEIDEVREVVIGIIERHGGEVRAL